MGIGSRRVYRTSRNLIALNVKLFAVHRVLLDILDTCEAFGEKPAVYYVSSRLPPYGYTHLVLYRRLIDGLLVRHDF